MVNQLARGLVSTLQPIGGRAYRLDSSRFAALTPAEGAASGEAILAAPFAQEAARGGELLISRSYGEVIVPDETGDPEAALRLAGQRVTAYKQRQQRSASRQAHAVLMAVLAARRPELRGHLRTVAYRSISLSRRLGIDARDDRRRLPRRRAPGHRPSDGAGVDARETRRAHRVGGDDDPQASGRGAQIVATAPGLAYVATIVRAISERYDGCGHPDRLAGDEIPIGARIIAVCVALAAMIAARPYRPARTVEAAIAELRDAPGTQFDPTVVEALAADIEEERAGFSAALATGGEQRIPPEPSGAPLTPLPDGAGV